MQKCILTTGCQERNCVSGQEAQSRTKALGALVMLQPSSCSAICKFQGPACQWGTLSHCHYHLGQCACLFLVRVFEVKAPHTFLPHWEGQLSSGSTSVSKSVFPAQSSLLPIVFFKSWQYWCRPGSLHWLSASQTLHPHGAPLKSMQPNAGARG